MIFRDEKRRNGWWVEIHVLVGRVVEHENVFFGRCVGIRNLLWLSMSMG